MRRRFGRGRQRGQDNGPARTPIDAADAIERVRASGATPAATLEPHEVEGIPSHFAALGLGADADGKPVAVAYAPQRGADAALAALAWCARRAADEAPETAYVAISADWSAADRRRLGWMSPAVPLSTLAASSLAGGAVRIAAEPPPPVAVDPRAVVERLDRRPERDAYQRALAGLEGLAAKYGGALRGRENRAQLVVAAQRVADLFAEADAVRIEIAAPDDARLPLGSGDALAAALDRLEAVLRKRASDRRARSSEPGMRGALLAVFERAEPLRSRVCWPLGGPHGEPIDFVGTDVDGRRVVGAARDRLGLDALAEILDGAAAAAPIDAQTPAASRPRLVLAAVEFERAALEACAALGIDIALFDARDRRNGDWTLEPRDGIALGDRVAAAAAAAPAPAPAPADDDSSRSRSRSRPRRRGPRDAAPAASADASDDAGEGEAEPTSRFEEMSLFDLDDDSGSGSGGAGSENSEDGSSRRRRGRGRRRGRRGRGSSERGQGGGGDSGARPEPRAAASPPDDDDDDIVGDDDETLTAVAEVPEIDEPETPAYEDEDDADDEDRAADEARRARETKRRARIAAPVEPPPPPRRRAAFLAHADPVSVLTAIVLARDVRLVESFWVYPQSDLMTFFRSVATDLKDQTPIFLIGFAAGSPARDTFQAASLYAGRLDWYDHHDWPPEDLETLRATLGADHVHVEPGAESSLAAVIRERTRRSRFTDKLVELINGRFTQHDYERWGRWWWHRAQEIAAKPGDRRADVEPLLAGRPSELARAVAQAPEPPLPPELSFVSQRDFRLVHFGGLSMVVLEVPPELDLHLAARIARERYASPLSLATRGEGELVVLSGDDTGARHGLDLGGMCAHLATKHAWVEALADDDHVARMRIQGLRSDPSRLDELITEIAMGRSIVEG